MIKKYLSGQVKIWFKNKELIYEKLIVKKQPMSKTQEYKCILQQKSKIKRNLAANSNPIKKTKPAITHPWRASTKQLKKAANFS